MSVFSVEERDRVRDHVLELAPPIAAWSLLQPSGRLRMAQVIGGRTST